MVRCPVIEAKTENYMTTIKSTLPAVTRRHSMWQHVATCTVAVGRFANKYSRLVAVTDLGSGPN